MHANYLQQQFQQQSSRSWYGGGWPRGSKASPVTQVAKESIAAATSVASDLVTAARTSTPRNSPSSFRSPLLHISHSIGSSSRSLPLEATTTKLNITSNVLDSPPEDASTLQVLTAVNESSDEQIPKSDLNKDQSGEETKPKIDQQDVAGFRPLTLARFRSEDKPISQGQAGGVSSGWLGWFSKPINHSTQGPDASITVADESFNPISPGSPSRVASQDQQPISDHNSLVASNEISTQPRFWLGLWNNGAPAPEKTKASVATHAPREFSNENPKPQNIRDVPERNNNSHSSTSEAQMQQTEVPKSTGWAFWSRDQSNEESSESKDKFGKLALAGSPSQSHPENAVIDEVKGVPSKLGKMDKKNSLEPIGDQKLSNFPKNVVDEGRKPKVTSTNSKSKSTEQTRTEAKTTITNLVLPSLKQTYRAIESPNLIQRFSRFLQYKSLPDTKNVNILSNPPRIRRALAIVRMPPT